MLTMDSTDTAPDFINDSGEDLADVIGDEAGLAMEFESDEVDNDRLWRVAPMEKQQDTSNYTFNFFFHYS